MEEPLTHSLIAVSKKYLSLFSKEASHLSIDKYQYILVLIDDHKESLTQKALSELLQVDKSYMVTILDYLCGKGYVIREKNPNDRREQLIKLTEKARTDIPVIRKVISDLNQKSMKTLSKEQVKTFYEVISVIQENLSDSKPNEIFLEYKKI
ncbi:MarR family winged helix-turn-helix transcriptional regulator [Daejeonella oryzae]|uniref:MarR family winged helix-turn-helix transcriptional regulator n=1 Tax=Daejeonella oryzae TaxID=1122943 RepID=UPI000426D540|nr:MarR family transcriptional regulator [Daejeonella oryzae]